MDGLIPVIPASAGIQGPNQAVSFRKSGTPYILDSGFRRSDEAEISYAIALAISRALLVFQTLTIRHDFLKFHCLTQ